MTPDIPHITVHHATDLIGRWIVTSTRAGLRTSLVNGGEDSYRTGNLLEDVADREAQSITVYAEFAPENRAGFQRDVTLKFSAGDVVALATDRQVTEWMDVTVGAALVDAKQRRRSNASGPLTAVGVAFFLTQAWPPDLGSWGVLVPYISVSVIAGLAVFVWTRMNNAANARLVPADFWGSAQKAHSAQISAAAQ